MGLIRIAWMGGLVHGILRFQGVHVNGSTPLPKAPNVQTISVEALEPLKKLLNFASGEDFGESVFQLEAL
jgi:hypothetical protein